MRAVTWHGRHDVRVDTVPDPEIVNPRDCIIKITSTAICGSDLHLYDGYIPTMRAGDILGHENMGEVVEVGAKIDPEEGPAGGDSVHHLLRVLLLLREAAIFRLRQQQSRRDVRRVGNALRLSDGRGVRLRPPDRWLCRRPGRISARSL